MSEKEATLTDHLGELRKRIIWIIVSFVIALGVSFTYSIDVFRLIRDDIFHGVRLITFSPPDALRIYMQISFILSFVVISPIIMYHIWRFVSPGLRPRERRAALFYIPLAVLLFLAGLAFGYFVVLPYMLGFMNSLTAQMGLDKYYRAADSFGFLFNILFPVALLFELPVVVMFLTGIRLLNPQLLRKGRRIAYMLLVILAAMVAPPDVVSNLIVAIPLILLYEISIILSVWVYRRMQKAEMRAREAEQLENGE